MAYKVKKPLSLTTVFLLTFLFIHLQSSNIAPYTCFTSADCPFIASICDGYGLCESNPTLKYPTGTNYSLGDTPFAFQAKTDFTYFFSNPPLNAPIDLTYTLTMAVGSNSTTLNIYVIVDLGTTSVLIASQEGVRLNNGENTVVQLSTIQLSNNQNGLNDFVIIVVQASPPGDNLVIQQKTSDLSTPNIYLIMAYTVGALFLILSAFCMILGLRRRQLAQDNEQISKKNKEFDISHFEVYTPVIKCSLDMKNSTQVCSVCLQQLQIDGLIRKTICLHIFHKECIDEWCKKNLTCPMCRKQLNLKAMEEAKQNQKRSLIASAWINNSLFNQNQQFQQCQQFRGSLRENLIGQTPSIQSYRESNIQNADL